MSILKTLGLIYRKGNCIALKKDFVSSRNIFLGSTAVSEAEIKEGKAESIPPAIKETELFYPEGQTKSVSELTH